MGQQTIEELEIVIKAKIDDAIKGIKQVTNTIKNEANSTSVPIAKVSEQVTQASQKAVVQTQNAINKIKSQDLKIKPQDISDLTDFEFDDTTSFETQIEFLRDKLEGLKEEYEQVSNGKPFKGQKEVLQGYLIDIEKTQNALNNLEKKQKDLENETEKTTSKGVNGFENLWKSLKRGTLMLLGVRSAFALFRQGMNSAVGVNEELQSTMNVTSNAIGQIFVPIMQKLQNAIQYVIIAVARVVELLTHWNILSKVTTQNINNTNKSAKALSKTLSSIDDIDVLNSGDNSLTSGGYLNDLKALEDFQNKVKEVNEWLEKHGFIKFFERVREILDNFFKSNTWKTIKSAGSWLLDHPDALATFLGVLLGAKLLTSIGKLSGLLGSLQTLLGLGAIATLGYVIYNMGKDIGEIVDNMKNLGDASEQTTEMIKDINDEIANGTRNADDLGISFNTAKTNIYNLRKTAGGSLNAIFNNKNWKKALDEAVNKYKDVNETIREMINNHQLTNDEMETSKQYLKEEYTQLKELRDSTAKGTDEWNYYNNMMKDCKSTMELINSDLYGMVDVTEEINDQLGTKFLRILKVDEDGVQKLITTSWNGTQKVYDSIEEFEDEFGRIELKGKNSASSILGSYTNFTNSAKDGLKSVFDNSSLSQKINSFADKVKGIFNKEYIMNIGANSKGLTTNVASSLTQAIGGALSSVVSTLKSGILNPSVVINTALSKVKGVLGFAKGNVATSPTLAVFGEYANAKSNPEITAPQNILRQTFREELSSSGTDGINRITINLGSKEIFDEFIDYVNDKTENNGTSVFKEAY